jgi:hypothetical protein
VREKKPSTRIWKLEEEAREKGGSSEKLTKIIKKKKNTQHAMGSRKSSRTRHRLTTRRKRKIRECIRNEGNY